MRWLALSIAAAAALSGATYALASGGSQGDQGTAPAYALVDPNVDATSGVAAPRLIVSHSSGFVSVSSPQLGIYCLTPASGVDVVHTAAVASEEAFYSYVVGFPVVRYDPVKPADCATNQLEVKTFVDVPNTALSNQIAFTVNVP